MAGPRLSTMAWRNIWRNRRRTLITLVSIAFGTFLAVLMTGIGDSSYTQMIDHSARLGGGHVIVQHPDYIDTPSLKSTVMVDPGTIEAITAREEVRTAVPRVTGGLMLQSAANSVGAMVLGIDPRVEDETTLGFVDALAEGEMFTEPDASGIIIGRTLAENLDVGLGKKVVYKLTDKSGEITEGLVRVTGILETGAAEIDAGTCLLPIDSFREQLGYAPGEVTQVAVFLDNHRDADDVAAALGAELGSDVAVLTWDQAKPDLAGFITMKVVGALIFEAFVTVLIAAGIFNTLFVSVMERMREFGILAAIGFSRLQLIALVLWESLWIGLCGIVASVLLSAGPYYYLATTGIDYSKMVEGEGQAQVAGITMEPILYVELYPPHFLFIGAAVVLATVAAGLYPAYKAGKVSPVEAIRIV